jgi:steroid 5-alpha reductase family enzyme
MTWLPATPLLSPGTAFLLGAGVSIAIMVVTWLIQCRTRNAGIVDTVWGFTVVAPAVAVALGSITQASFVGPALMVACILIWALRLAVHLHSRYQPAVEDGRYAALRAEWGDQAQVRMLRFYLMQALGSFLLALPLVVIATAPPSGLLISVGFAALVLLSVTLESVADAQLAAYKRQANRPGGICDRGLWAWSRHPNYFFEWTAWVGFALWALAVGSFPLSLMALVAPVMMYHFVTGVRPTEEHLARSRPEAFAAYAAQVPAFFPRPPRR